MGGLLNARIAHSLGFAAVYGLIVINWVDLFKHSLPGYSVWLTLIYFAPGMGVVSFAGLRHWRLALAMGLVASLANDLGFFFLGDVVFGFNEPLGPWLLGQLGLEWTKPISTLRVPYGKFPVYSWEMGASIWVRISALGWGLLAAWRSSPTQRFRSAVLD